MTVTGLDGRNLTAKKEKLSFAKPNGKLTVNFAFKIGGANAYDPSADFDVATPTAVDVAKAATSVAGPGANEAAAAAPHPATPRPRKPTS